MIELNDPTEAENIFDNMDRIQNTGSTWKNFFWLGLSKHYTWKWVSGEPLVYKNWAVGFPKDDAQNNCAVAYTDSYTDNPRQWKTMNCKSKRFFICES